MTSTSFLPDDYKTPVSPSNYMKLLDGENTFRVLTSAIVGFAYWTTDDKPVRLKEMPIGIPSNIRMEKDKKTGEEYPSKVKHFWAFVVWNEGEKKIQVLEITQKSIMNGMLGYVRHAKWGDPKTYDITINRSGEGFDTEYQVIANPKSDIPPLAVEEFLAKKVNLEALYEGADPFAGSYPTPHSEGINLEKEFNAI